MPARGLHPAEGKANTTVYIRKNNGERCREESRGPLSKGGDEHCKSAQREEIYKVSKKVQED